MPEDLIRIEITTPEAMLFRDFQQFHKTFALLTTKGVFDIKGGSAVIHFDIEGNIAKIERHDNLYDIRVKNLT